MLGSASASMLADRVRPLLVAIVCWGLAAGCVCLIGVAQELWQVMVLLGLESWSAIIGFVLALGAMMERTPRHLRGRVASLDDFASNSLVSLSFVVAGSMAASWSTRGALVVGGLVELVAVVVVLALAGRALDRAPADADGEVRA